jgi:hypothetical protein
VFEATKKGEKVSDKDLSDKKNQVGWSLDNLARIFRELYSNFNWLKVFEALSEISEELVFDVKAF